MMKRNVLKTTLVVGALATGGAIAGIAGAAAAPSGTTGTTPTQTQTTPTTPKAPPRGGSNAAPRAGHPCPHMGSGSGNFGSAYQGASPGPAPST
jgi:hypothetical protein